MFKTYYRLAKPGIVYGNSLAVIAGFLLAAQGDIHLLLFAGTVVGLALVMGSGCVINNIIDRGIDKKMKRTQNRSLVTGEVTVSAAALYGAVLGVTGLFLVWLGGNLLAATIGLVGWIFYVALYGWAKRHSVHGTLVGSVAGAVPPVVGYVAVTNGIDAGAVLLFVAMTLWQMPHFYAIAIFRKQDYEAAGIPTLPSVWGMKVAVLHILGYIIAYAGVVAALTFAGYTGYVYLFGMLGLTAYWLWRALQGTGSRHYDQWARGMFGASLWVLLGFCTLLSINAYVI